MHLWLSQNPSGSAEQRATVESQQSLMTDEASRGRDFAQKLFGHTSKIMAGNYLDVREKFSHCCNRQKKSGYEISSIFPAIL